MWQPGDVIAWRGIAYGRPWHIQSGIVVSDSPEELVVVVLPGSESVAEKSYVAKYKGGKRRWEFKDHDWELDRYAWHTNRLLAITEPEKYYSIMLFWNNERNEFLGYYVNFQLPFKRSQCGIDTLDLDLDIDMEPDLSYRWKDEEDYQLAVTHGAITQEWAECIEAAKPEILERIEKRQYPFDGAWLDWEPDPTWSPPNLPAGWDKI
jgi:protein associated with RNAse G/E